MAQFVKAGSRIINLEHVAHIRVWHREHEDEELIVDVATVATAGKDEDGENVEVVLMLKNEDAEEFLRSVYTRGNFEGHRPASFMAEGP